MAGIRSLGVTIAVALCKPKSCSHPLRIAWLIAETDSAIFHSRITKLLPGKIAAAALSNGLPKPSLPRLIADLANNDSDELGNIPGITPRIIDASVIALKEAYLESFKSVWIAVCCFCAVGVIGKIADRVSNKSLLAKANRQAPCCSSTPQKTSIITSMLLPSLSRICTARQITYGRENQRLEKTLDVLS